MSKILIKNGKVWDGERFFKADILTDNDKISKIEASINENAEYVFVKKAKLYQQVLLIYICI